MNGYLLDTHTAIWFFTDDSSLSSAADQIILNRNNRIYLSAISAAHLTVLKDLPHIHRDPFDRLLIATALAEQMTLITADDNIVRYKVPHIW